MWGKGTYHYYIQLFFFFGCPNRKGREVEIRVEKEKKNEINNIGACVNRNSWTSYIIKTTQECVDT